MKTFVILSFLLLFFGMGNAQDSLTVSMDDWKFIQKTTQELETALDDCDTLNVKYEKRMSLFQMQVAELEQSNIMCDSIFVAKDKQLEMRKEQISLLNHKIQKQELELIVTRTGGIIIAVVAILLLK
jgi:hypothetical protein